MKQKANIIMCGRFELNIPKDKLIQKFGINNWQLDTYTPRFNIPPTTSIPIIKQIGNQRIGSAAHWGLIPSWAKDRKIAFRTFNARSETVAEKPSFRSAYKKRRCVIPATAYYEWKKLDAKNKQPYKIERKDKEPLLMAGLFENWTDTHTGELIESCTVITRDAYTPLEEVHTRMPVLLPHETIDVWLDASENNFPTIDMNSIDYYPISNDVGSPRNDHYFERLNNI